MIGVSLSPGLLLEDFSENGSVYQLLKMLKEQGVGSIELRAIPPNTCPEMALKVANRLWDMGFQITVHGAVSEEKTAVEGVFAPLKKVLRHLRQRELNITVHPTVWDNVAILTAMSDYILEHKLPVKIALENNRLLPGSIEGDSTALVLDIVQKVDRENVGICFDMGHYTYYLRKNHPDKPLFLPDKEFFKRVIHTHIHGMNGLKTHDPLTGDNLPIQEYFDALGHGYLGVYNIELTFSRFEEKYSPSEALRLSVETLKKNLPGYAEIYDDIRNHFDRDLLTMLPVLKQDGTGTRMGLMNSSAYLFNTNGFLWGLDPAFLHAHRLASTPAQIHHLLKDFQLMIISHGHGDHFEKRTVELLSQTQMHWVIPDFLEEKALEYGIAPEKMTVACEDQPIQIGELTILPFRGHHFRPNNGPGLAEYGYYITAPDSPSMIFPVDTRNYAIENMPQVPEADYCFAHVWMGDGNCLEADYSPIDQQFASFMLALSSRNIFLAHLNVNSAALPKMWRERHARLLTGEILRQSPQTVVRTPRRGEVIQL